MSLRRTPRISKLAPERTENDVRISQKKTRTRTAREEIRGTGNPFGSSGLGLCQNGRGGRKKGGKGERTKKLPFLEELDLRVQKKNFRGVSTSPLGDGENLKRSDKRKRGAPSGELQNGNHQVRRALEKRNFLEGGGG